MLEDKLYYIWLQQILWSNSSKLRLILKKYGNLKNCYEHSCKKGLDASIFTNKQLEYSKNAMEKAKEIVNSCENNAVKIISYGEKMYPERLKNIYNPPLVIYYRGEFPDIDNMAAIAIVGTRSATKEGCSFAEQLSHKLTKCGIIIVSGGALGIDSAALRAALDAGGRPICVTATGQDKYYPIENKKLFDKISQQALILSEYPPGITAIARNFPVRNRIISALSLGVAVIEAPMKSGAIITANIALEQGKDVFSVPGSVMSYTSEGSNQLLKLGAVPLTSYEDIIQMYLHKFDGLKYYKNSSQDVFSAKNKAVFNKQKKTENKLPKPINSSNIQDTPNKDDRKLSILDIDKLSSNAQKLYKALSVEKDHIEELILKADLSASEAMIAISELQIYNLIRTYPGKMYSL